MKEWTADCEDERSMILRKVGKGTQRVIPEEPILQNRMNCYHSSVMTSHIPQALCLVK